MLDDFELMPDGDWKVAKTDDNYHRFKIKSDEAAEFINPQQESANRNPKESKGFNPETQISNFSYNKESGHFTATVPKAMVEFTDYGFLGYNEVKKKENYGDIFVLTNQGYATPEKFDGFIGDIMKYAGQNSDVEHGAVIYEGGAKFWNQGDTEGVTLQPALDVMDANGREAQAPKQIIHTHPINSYVGVDTKRYNLGSSKTDRNLARDIEAAYKSKGYEGTVNKVFNPVFSNDFIEYNAEGDIGVENSVSNRMKINGNVQAYDYFRNNK